jgi:type I restriction enzyme S subunit
VADHAESIIIRPLSDLAEINPDTYSPKDKWKYVNYLDTSSITNGIMSEIQMINPDTEKLPSRARRIIKAGDIVYSTVRPNQLHFGIISSPMENMLASTGFAVIRSKHAYICNPYLYLFLTSSDFIEKMQQLAEQSTSTFPSVKPSDIGTCMIPCADEEEMLEITEQIVDLYTMNSANHQENRRLAELRDTLLPKLMNGELDVSSLDL